MYGDFRDILLKEELFPQMFPHRRKCVLLQVGEGGGGGGGSSELPESFL